MRSGVGSVRDSMSGGRGGGNQRKIGEKKNILYRTYQSRQREGGEADDRSLQSEVVRKKILKLRKSNRELHE